LKQATYAPNATAKYARRQKNHVARSFYGAGWQIPLWKGSSAKMLEWPEAQLAARPKTAPARRAKHRFAAH